MSELQENLHYPLLNMCRKFYTLELIGNLVFLLVLLLLTKTICDREEMQETAN